MWCRSCMCWGRGPEGPHWAQATGGQHHIRRKCTVDVLVSAGVTWRLQEHKTSNKKTKQTITRVQPSYFDSTFATRGVVATPWILVFPTDFFVNFFMGIASGSRNPMVIVKIFYLYHVTLKLKVIDLVHGCRVTPWSSLSRSWSGSTAFIHRFSNSFTQKHIDIDTMITFLACF